MPAFPREEMVQRWLEANRRCEEAGDWQWSWQRDWFDYGNAAALFLEMMSDGTLSDGMTARMHRALGGDVPGQYPLGTAPVGLWEVSDS